MRTPTPISNSLPRPLLRKNLVPPQPDFTDGATVGEGDPEEPVGVAGFGLFGVEFARDVLEDFGPDGAEDDLELIGNGVVVPVDEHDDHAVVLAVGLGVENVFKLDALVLEHRLPGPVAAVLLDLRLRRKDRAGESAEQQGQ